MRFTSPSCLAGSLTIVLLFLSPGRLSAQVPDPGTVWRCQLTDGSQLTDECPICDRIPFVIPMRGSFDLRCLDHNPLYSHYALDNIDFVTTGTNWSTYRVRGQGWFEIGGELALRQTMYLEVLITNDYLTNLCFFTNSSLAVTRTWPMLQLALEQTNGTPAQKFYLDLNVAPLREIWFSSVEKFTAGIWNSPTNIITGGDLISSAGRVVKRNHQLSANLGIMPVIPDLGLKDFDVLPHGEVAFSMEQFAFSETLGRSLRPGDLLSNRGGILKTNEQLTMAFQPDLTFGSDFGLNGIKTREDGTVWFSVQTNFHSKALACNVGHGDLLSDSGVIIRTNSELIARFKPNAATGDVGLRAFYVWPGGEIWFVIDGRFSGGDSVVYGPGDLLSDQGYLVYRAAELFSTFNPVDATRGPELDALYVITDAAATEAPPKLQPPQPTNAPPGSLALTWQGPGRVFQLETVTNLARDFSIGSPIIPDQSFIVIGAQTNSPSSFYRLRQW